MIELLGLGWEALFSLGVVVLCFALFAWTRIAPDLVTTGGLTLLLVSGILTTSEALAGFANPGVITVAVLYVVVTGLTETGAVTWISQGLLGRPRRELWAQLRLMLPVAGLSAFLNNTPVVAIFIPAVADWAKRNQLRLSKLLIPLSYASIAGGTCTLLGTSTNLVVNGLYIEQTGTAGFGVFDLAWIGLPLVATVMLFVLLTGRWLLPARSAATATFEDVRRYTVEMLVEPDNALVGKTVEEAGLRQLPGLFLVEIERRGRLIPVVSPREPLEANDRLVFAGVIDSVMELQSTRGLMPATDQVFKLDTPRHNRCFVEAVISNKSPVIGRRVREGRFRDRYDAVIIALSRHGERVDGRIGDMVLKPGDTLLLECRPNFVLRQRDSRDFLVVSQLGDAHPPRHKRAPLALAIVLAMVVTAGFGLLSMLQAALLAAGAMILSGCTPGQIARRAPDRQVLLVISTAFGIGAALEKTGVAPFLADALIGLAQGNPLLSLALVFLTTAVLTSVATNNVAAVLAFPIAMDTAQQMQVDPIPFMVTIMVAASASFATPIGYQTNLMVFHVGGYRFGDFIRIGVPLTLLVGLVTLALVPLIWPF